MEAAFALFELDSAHGGVRCEDEFGVAFEEYPTNPPSIVLNGLISALWGLGDLAIVQARGRSDDTPAHRLFRSATTALLARLHRYDLGFWSRYCLFPHAVPNVASPYYHRAHLAQLSAMARIAPDPRWDEMHARWSSYQRSPACRAVALAGKAAFRIVHSWELTGRPHLFDRSGEFEPCERLYPTGGHVRDRG
jgi:hypothetical protein